MSSSQHHPSTNVSGHDPSQTPPKCDNCNDTGFVDYWDSLGDLRGYTYCHCPLGDEKERVWSPKYRAHDKEFKT